MQILIGTLLIANITVVLSASVYVAKEVDKLNRRIEDLENSLDLKEIREKLKEHITQEFWNMSLRGIKISDLRK
ncbi:hypothetical protein [Clostridium rectalis]|uniref:hypothetical protein n=1 Tax=Clostridium rectalis TaxID=2040295 RepID=UPI000F632EDF|nr:hypothetical protein [Clostridium rectalis]